MADDTAGSKGGPKAKSAGDDAAKAAASFDTVGSLSVHEQVELLAQALLREFMHRRGYAKTLRAFDSECPRDERTISSRQLMRQLLEIPSSAFPSRLGGGDEADDGKGKNKKKKAQPTFMEELCSYRVQKREVEQRRIAAKGDGEGGGSSSGDDIIDPSDKEVEELRSAALDVERLVEEARERHERLLEERRERKKERKRAEKKSKNKDKNRSKEGDGGRSVRKGKRQGGGEADFDPFGSDDNGGDDGGSSFFTRRTSAKKQLRWAHDDDDDRDECGEGAGDAYGMGGSGGSGRAGKAVNLLEEPEFLLSSIDKRKASRAGVAQVGSGWTPGGGGLEDVGINTMPMRKSVEADLTRPPSFIAGDGMSLMTERMQADKKPRDAWRPPAPLPVSSAAAAGGGGGGLRGSAGFRGESCGPLGPVSFGQRGLNGGGTRFHHGASSSLDCLGSSSTASGDSKEGKGSSPPGSGGILVSSSETIGRGYDGSLRPVASALRQSGALKDKGGSGADGSSTAGRKARRVTILVD